MHIHHHFFEKHKLHLHRHWHNHWVDQIRWKNSNAGPETGTTLLYFHHKIIKNSCNLFYKSSSYLGHIIKTLWNKCLVFIIFKKVLSHFHHKIVTLWHKLYCHISITKKSFPQTVMQTLRSSHFHHIFSTIHWKQNLSIFCDNNVIRHRKLVEAQNYTFVIKLCWKCDECKKLYLHI